MCDSDAKSIEYFEYEIKSQYLIKENKFNFDLLFPIGYSSIVDRKSVV